MEFRYLSADGVTHNTFSRTSTQYRLLKNYTGTSNLPVAHQTVRAPYQDGVTRLDTNATERRITFDIMILGSSLEDLQTNIATLSEALNPLAGEGWLYFQKEDGTSYYLKAIPDNTPVLDTSERGLFHQRASLSFIAHDPFWYTSGTATTLTLSISGHAVFPFYGVTQSATRPTKHIMGAASPTGTANNTGNWPSSVTCTIYGEMVDPVITDTTTGDYMSFSGTIAAGARLVFTTGYGKQSVRYYSSGADMVGTNAFSYVNIGSTFFLLDPGTNVISLTYSSALAPSSAVITWESKYTGV